MRQVADGVFQIPLLPRSALNAYLVGDVLVDAGTVAHGDRVARAVRGRPVTRLVVTHARTDHAGGARRAADLLGVPVQAGAADLGTLRAGGRGEEGTGLLRRLGTRARGYPGVDAATGLEDGDEVGAGFVVVAAPGPTPGHLALWRATDGVLVCGDAVTTVRLSASSAAVREAPGLVARDRAVNRATVRRLADLRPQTVLCGHGQPLMSAAIPMYELARSLRSGNDEPPGLEER